MQEMRKFNLKNSTTANVASMSGYVPGEQPSTRAWVKLNTNEFPYPPSPRVRSAIISEIGADASKLRLYPDPLSSSLRRALEKRFGLPTGFGFAANGSDDVLNLAVRAFTDSQKSAVSLDPSYSLYPVLAKIQNTKFIEIPFKGGMEIPFDDVISSGANLLFFTNPNAPTGIGFPIEAVERFAKNFNGIVLVDEAYSPFSSFTAAPLVKKYDNLIVVGTSSKGWGLAGMRIGWALANPKIIDILDRVRDSYNLDRLAQVAGIAALDDEAYYAKMRVKIISEREACQTFFDSLSWPYFKSSSNFILFTPRDAGGKSGPKVAANFFGYLRSRKILLRYFPREKNINMSLRISIGTHVQMEKFKKAAKAWLKEG